MIRKLAESLLGEAKLPEERREIFFPTPPEIHRLPPPPRPGAAAALQHRVSTLESNGYLLAPPTVGWLNDLRELRSHCRTRERPRGSIEVRWNRQPCEVPP